VQHPENAWRSRSSNVKLRGERSRVAVLVGEAAGAMPDYGESRSRGGERPGEGGERGVRVHEERQLGRSRARRHWDPRAPVQAQRRHVQRCNPVGRSGCGAVRVSKE